ncbi:MAG: glycosyltransferase family 1 protein [Burkholderiaceae bacterium]|nr:MAG: glycosyltransferase family 1 protein [Burkholderiaceae bacterium]
MRILQLNIERGWRGGERQTLLCMRQFRATGHEAELAARKGGALAKAAAAEGFVVHEVGGMGSLVGFLLRCGRGFDVLHAQTANTLTWLALLKWWLRRPVVFTRRTAFSVPAARLRKTVWKWRKADAFVAISEAAAAQPRGAGLSVALIPSAVVEFPVDLQHIRAFAEKRGLAGKRVIATAAALTHEKDPFTLIRAIAILRQTRDDFVFLHLGAAGDVAAQAFQLVRELGLERHYLFAGFQSRIEDLYRLMDVFVLSSREEALGSSVLDAFLYSVPVVATDAGGLPELTADGRGLSCKVGDAQGIAQALGRVLDDADLRKGMVARARDYVLREHDATTMARRYLDEYARVSGEGIAPGSSSRE